MSSIPLEDTISNAIARVTYCYPRHRGLDVFLKSIKERFLLRDTDPRVNRDLIVEAKHDSQILDIPIETVEVAIGELVRLNVLHVWVRISCPSSPNLDETIAETNDAAEFKNIVSQRCHFCGQIHEDITVNDVELFYAFNPDRTLNKKKKFNIKRFILTPSEVGLNVSDATKEHISLIERLYRFFSSGACKSAPVNPVVSGIERKLSINQPLSPVPTSSQIGSSLAESYLVMFVIGIAIVLPTFAFAGNLYGVLSLALFMLCLGAKVYIELRKMLRIYFVPSMLAAMSLGLVAILLYKPFATLSFFIHGENYQASFSTESSSVENIIRVICATLVFIALLGFVAFFDPKKYERQ